MCLLKVNLREDLKDQNCAFPLRLLEQNRGEI